MSDIIQIKNSNFENFEINPENIKRSAYTNSLLEEALRAGAVTEDDVIKVQTSVMDALEKAINLYTHENSTSVMTETAQDLLKSVITCIDEYLVSLESHEKALYTLLKKDSVELYLLGYHQLKSLVLEGVSLMVKLKKSKLDLDNSKYETTIDKFIPELLKSYSANKFYKTHFDGIFTISHFYPLACPLPNAGAVIRSLLLYMNALIEENRFCAQIPGVKILYNEYKEQHIGRPVYAGDNIYAVTLHNAIFAVLSNRKPGSLRVDVEDCHHLSQSLGGLSRDELATKLAEAAVVLGIGDSRYAMNVLRYNLPQISHAIMCDSLDNILVAY